MNDSVNYSFKKISDKNGICTYYTNPSKAKVSTDNDGIVTYYEKSLGEIGNKKWIWIFDTEGFDMKQSLEVRTGSGIADLITKKYGENLIEIKVINPTWQIKAIMAIIWPFLNDVTRHKIKIMGDRYYSLLEFI